MEGREGRKGGQGDRSTSALDFLVQSRNARALDHRAGAASPVAEAARSSKLATDPARRRALQRGRKRAA
jgi:hypothetical protein